MTKQNLVKMVCDKCGKTETVEQIISETDKRVHVQKEHAGWYNVHLKTVAASPKHGYDVNAYEREHADANREHEFCAACVDEFLAPVRKREEEEHEEAIRKSKEEHERYQLEALK